VTNTRKQLDEFRTTDKAKYSELLNVLIFNAQNDNTIATDILLEEIKQHHMRRRISRFTSKNCLLEDDDIRQEFMIGCAIGLTKAKLDVGEPFLFILQSGTWQTQRYVKKHINQGTMQTCRTCGNKSRLNIVDNNYVCKKCGSTDVATDMVSDKNEITFDNLVDEYDDLNTMILDDTVEALIVGFEDLLKEGTNVTRLFDAMIRRDINTTNPDVENYLKQIAKEWDTSAVNVNFNLTKLRKRFRKYLDDIEQIDDTLISKTISADKKFTFIDNIIGGGK